MVKSLTKVQTVLRNGLRCESAATPRAGRVGRRGRGRKDLALENRVRNLLGEPLEPGEQLGRVRCRGHDVLAQDRGPVDRVVRIGGDVVHELLAHERQREVSRLAPKGADQGCLR